MKVIYYAVIIILSYSISVDAQHLENKLHYSVDLYEGLDKDFYTESNFGVKNPIYSAFPVNSMLRYNRVDGLFIGYQEEKMDWNNSNCKILLPDLIKLRINSRVWPPVRIATEY